MQHHRTAKPPSTLAHATIMSLDVHVVVSKLFTIYCTLPAVRKTSDEPFLVLVCNKVLEKGHTVCSAETPGDALQSLVYSDLGP